MRRLAPLLAAVAVAAALIAVYLALGGASYAPTPLADPCETRPWRSPDGIGETIEQIALSGLDGAACELGTSREELVLALRDEQAFDAFVADNRLTRTDAEAAVEQGVERAIADAEDAGALPGLVATLAKATLGRVPPWLLLDALERVRGLLD